ncbi:unnamed protein product [Dicrocoelium dendriticum]|nr:unnamed protein product [Dicrocoelium dendriticum]
MRRKRRHQSQQGNFAHATKQADLSHATDAGILFCSDSSHATGVHHDMFVRAPEYADFEVDLGIPPRLMSPIYISDENDCKPPRKLSPNAVSNGSSPIASQAALAMSMTINCDEASILPSTRATCQMSAPKIARKEIFETQTQNEANLKPVLSETATQVSVQLTDSLGLSSSLMSDTDTGVCNAAPNLGDGEERTEFVSAPQDLDSRNLDDRLLDILKRLDKPDVTTRQKALRDLSSLLQYKDPLTFSVVIAFLPYWSPVFCRLSEDADANVRKFTQMVMFRLVRRVYHELRPYLKQVLPLWVYGSTDRHSEASRWAHEGLSTAFLKVRNFEAHRLCAEQLLCLLEIKIELAVSQFFPLFAAKKGIARQHAKDEMPGDSEIDLTLERLARAVQFCRLVAIRLASLPDDNPYIQRLRSQLSPENLWSRVSRVVELSIWQSEFFLENAFEVHQYIYADSFSSAFEYRTSCYRFTWDAAIACLVNLPDSLVWSTVDWRSSLAPQLEHLFFHADLELVSEAYQCLRDLLRRLPVDFSALDEADCDMLQRVFITATLSGLERSLGLRSALNSLSFDIVDAIYELLRCARFMLDKTAPSGSFNSLDDLYRSSPLLRAVMRDMILRLLRVALDFCRDASKPCLKSTRLPMNRRTCLYSIFSQVAKLCVDMGKSDMCSKHLLLAHICDQIVQWSSEDPAIEMTDPCEPDTKCSQLGLIDPLRLIEFADAIAELDYPPWSLPPLPQTNRSPGSATQRTGYFVMKSEWCIALFTSLAKEVERRLNSAAMNTSLRSCLYLALFCLHGHLLDYYPCLISSFSSTLFSVILPGLPENIRWESLSSSVVRGLTRSWSLSDDAAPLHFPPNSICLQFFDHLYPTILNTLLFDSENLFRNIANLFSHLLAYWCAKSVLIETTDDDASSSLINISLLFHALSRSWFRNRERLPMIKESVFRKVADWIRPFFSGSVDMLKVHPPRIIHRLFVILLLALESDFSTDFDRRNRCCLQLGQLLFAMYRIHHFALVAEVLTPDSPLVLFTSEMVTSGHRPPLSLSNAFQRAERLLLSHVSSRIRDPNPTGDPYALAHSIYNLLFKIVQYSPYVSPRLIRFAKSLATQCPTPALASIWLSELTELIQKLSVCPFTDSCSPRSALFSVPTRHLLPSFGLSVDRALLASLVRLHQLGWQMGLPRQLRTVDSEHRQYIQCLSLLRA